MAAPARASPPQHADSRPRAPSVAPPARVRHRQPVAAPASPRLQPAGQQPPSSAKSGAGRLAAFFTDQRRPPSASCSPNTPATAHSAQQPPIPAGGHPLHAEMPTPAGGRPHWPAAVPASQRLRRPPGQRRPRKPWASTTGHLTPPPARGSAGRPAAAPAHPRPPAAAAPAGHQRPRRPAVAPAHEHLPQLARSRPREPEVAPVSQRPPSPTSSHASQPAAPSASQHAPPKCRAPCPRAAAIASQRLRRRASGGARSPAAVPARWKPYLRPSSRAGRTAVAASTSDCSQARTAAPAHRQPPPRATSYLRQPEAFPAASAATPARRWPPAPPAGNCPCPPAAAPARRRLPPST